MFSIVPYKRRDGSIFRYMDDLERSFFTPSVRGASQFRCDISDKGDHYLLAAELPGFSKEDIAIEHTNNNLTISATRQSQSDEKDSDGNYIRRERHFGSFSRTFDTTGIDTEHITANYKDGVLNLSLPKVKQDIPEIRKIEIGD
ncbi:Hsp20/alpha crystallin family protein [Ruminococcaceae bacterium OttesenSCG-928-A16]|nr:Hsp20/alpha crystallin family protein [Ruminococcaceae bacterium OttesenSCG-928-A16]